MKGIILTSHGNMAQGMLETTKLFFGEQEQLKAFCLQASDNPDEFVDVLANGIKEVDSGDGVIVFCDLLFGSPCNCMARILTDNVEVITGMNLSMVLEVLGSREFATPEVDHLLEVGQQGIKDLKAVFKEAQQQQQ